MHDNGGFIETYLCHPFLKFIDARAGSVAQELGEGLLAHPLAKADLANPLTDFFLSHETKPRPFGPRSFSQNHLPPFGLSPSALSVHPPDVSQCCLSPVPSACDAPRTHRIRLRMPNNIVLPESSAADTGSMPSALPAAGTSYGIVPPHRYLHSIASNVHLFPHKCFFLRNLIRSFVLA